MAKNTAIELLKALLLREVDLFCRRNQGEWKLPVSRMLEDIKEKHWRAVFFGGTLRSLLLSRLVCQKPGRPRDIDLVIEGPPLDILRQVFEHFIARETRFGGLQLRRSDWLFDVWPLERTWALVKDQVCEPDFADLPGTTFLNVEAVAVDVWPSSGLTRRIYSGDNDPFFHAILDRVLEINREENPFPELCVVRSLVMANDTGFNLGPRLAKYITDYGNRLEPGEFEEIQKKHYGSVKVQGNTLLDWTKVITDSLPIANNQTVHLPVASKRRNTFNDDACPYPYLLTVERWIHKRESCCHA